jgi:hypothetical protein
MIEDNFALSLFLSMILTVVTYMLVPVIFRLKCGKLPKKKARKICIINAIVVGLLWSLYHATQGMNINAAPALLWYFINYSMLKGKEESYSRVANNRENQPTIDTIDNNVTTSQSKIIETRNNEVDIESVKNANINFVASIAFNSLITKAYRMSTAGNTVFILKSLQSTLTNPVEKEYISTLLTLSDGEIKEIVNILYIKLQNV